MKVLTKKIFCFSFIIFYFILFFFYYFLFCFGRGNWYNPKTFSVALKNRRHCLLETSTRLCILMLTRPVRRCALLFWGGGSSSSEWCEDVCCFDRFVVRVVLCRLPLWDPFACGLLFFVLLLLLCLLRWCWRLLFCECDRFFGGDGCLSLLLIHFWISVCSSGGNAAAGSIAAVFKAFLVVVRLLLLLVIGCGDVLLCCVQVVVASRVAGNVDGSVSGNGSHYWLRGCFLVVELMIVK